MTKGNLKDADVYTIIKDRIQFLEVRPGTSIKENELSKELNCSRTPIREALIRLSDERLVNIFPQRGTYVSLIDFELANEIAYMRHLLDLDICLNLCRQKIDLSDDVAEIMLLMDLSIKRESIVDYIRLDNQFHELIFKKAKHEMIWRIIDNSRAHYNRILVLDFKRQGSMNKSFNDHTDIIEYIKNGAEESLVTILKKHHDIVNTEEREIEIRNSFPEYFPSQLSNET